MTTTVYDLAVEVVLYLVAFQRRVEDGEPVAYDDTRAEIQALLGELDRRSHGEPGLWDAWSRARVPLVYLIDEIMIINCPWEYRSMWQNDPLECSLLGAQQALGGDNFYRDCDEALKDLEVAERNNRPDVRMKVELVMVYYVALQSGFKGRYALDLDAWREFKAHVFAKLPAYAQTKTKQLFPEAELHTIRENPNYEPVMKLVVVLIFFGAALAVYLLTTWAKWDTMVGELRDHAKPAEISAGAVAAPSAAESKPAGT
ncbi:hypothetical protein RAS1_22630 [Phycisphaerae bacterium RAS1]|nr:hypothetical protein RAS1_22630 [Phycisphaerae bacterium RAS1]